MIAAGVMLRQGHEVRIHDTALEGWDPQRELGATTLLIGQSDPEIE